MRLPRFRAASAAAAPAPATASVDVMDIAYYLNWDWAIHQEDFTDADTYMWWCVSVRTDPNEAWMEAEDGTLWVVSFETDGTQVTSVGTPVESRLIAVPTAAADGATASAAVDRRRQRVLAAFHDRPEKPDRPTAAERPNHQEGPVRINIAALRERLGISATELPDDATEKQINDALAEGEAPAETPEAETPEGASPEAEIEEAPVEEPAPAAASTAPAAGTVVVDQERLAALEASEARRADEERDRVLDEAIASGRFAPSRRAHYLAAWTSDPDGTRRLLTASAADGGLAPNTVPVHQRGSARTDIHGDPGFDRVRASLGLKARKES